MFTFKLARSLVLVLMLIEGTNGFGSRILGTGINNGLSHHRIIGLLKATTDNDGSPTETKRRKRDKVMDFLRTKGVISARKDYSTAMGVDEGPAGKSGGAKVCTYECV